MNILLSTILSVSLLASASQPASDDANVRHKAMYLYNLVRYIDWSEDNVIIGVIGETPVTPELEKMAQKNSKIEVRKFADHTGITECNIVFIPGADNTNFYLAQNEIGDSPVLVVVDQKNQVIRGAEMGFYVEDNRLKFVANKKAIEQTGIKVSHTLLERAVPVN